MNQHEQAIAEQVRQREIAIEAAKRQTAPLLRTGWILVTIGWLVPIIPVIGMIGFPIAFMSAMVAGGIAASRGNSSGGLLLMLTGVIGTGVVGALWILIYTVLGMAVGFN